MTTLDMHAVILGLIDCTHSATDLDGHEVNTDDGSRNRTDVAQAGRALNALADRLDLLAALARQEYWALKGQRRTIASAQAIAFRDSIDPTMTNYIGEDRET